MNAMIVLLGGLVVLVLGYVLYGGWLAKQWGVDPKRPTPAQEMHDGVDYVPTKPPAPSTAPFRLPYLVGFPFCCGY